MRAVLQRVTRASVRVEGRTVGEIGAGLLVLLGVARDDEERDALYLAEKVLNLRVFEDAEGRMNLSLAEAGGALLVVSQFTLYGDARKGRRPSWFDAAPPERARTLYEFFVEEARRRGARAETGSFQAMMEVELVNDGPVTILLDSRKLF
ncbi:MAG TPA: D-aminoacyl-tRNA deacylase [Pyrinomonadaceae bacterium]|nr:D-aminoacyl-tRNA deacylase [Pyrinomonadaceae bacterium]